MKIKNIVLFFILTTILIACDENSLAPFASEFPSVDERFMMSMSYNNLNSYATIRVPNKDYKIYVCTDTHVAGEGLHKTLKTFISLYKNDKDCPAACCLGDLVEADQPYDRFFAAFDGIKEHPNKRDTMFTVLGNHDIFYKQFYAYRYHIAQTTSYYFVVESGNTKDLFICLDTATGTLGRIQMEWLKYVLENDAHKYRHIIVFTHVNLFRRDNTYADISTTSIEETYELMSLFKQYGVKQVWAGHDHARDEFIHGKVKYITIDSMEEDNPNAAYMILHVGEELNNTFHPIRAIQEEMYP